MAVGQNASECISFLHCRAENGDRRSCTISMTLRHAGEAVDIIEEIQQLPTEVSAAVVREVRIISLTKYSRSFPLISITHLSTIQEEEDQKKFGDAFHSRSSFSRSNQERQVIQSFASRPRM